MMGGAEGIVGLGGGSVTAAIFPQRLECQLRQYGDELWLNLIW